MKKLLYEQVIAGKKFESYQKEADYILSLIDKGKIRPVTGSPKNGKYPALHTRYWLIEEEKDYSELYDELRNNICALIDIDYYLQHIKTYEKERDYVIALSDYIDKHRADLSIKISENERSFAIWKKEKFLSGKSYDGISVGDVLKHCGIDKDYLGTFRTAEPLAYYSYVKDVPQNILILENLDPFYSIRRIMLKGNNFICGMTLGTLVYGGGKRVIRAFEDFEISSEPYMKTEGNHLYYAGDLDYEGIAIYEGLARRMSKEYRSDTECESDKDNMDRDIYESILSSDEKDVTYNKKGYCIVRPCMALYNRMLDKVLNIEEMPLMKNQKVIDIAHFANQFSKERGEKLIKILKSGRYVPQEILCERDYCDISNDETG